MAKAEVIAAKYDLSKETERELLADILASFSDTLSPVRAASFEGGFQLRVECDGREEVVALEISRGELTVAFDKVLPKPFLSIGCSFEQLCRITLGTMSPVRDVISGRIRLDRGLLSLGRFARFGALFSHREALHDLPTTIEHPEVWTPPERILLVNGSPRRHGSTRTMLDWFARGLPAEKVEAIDVSSLRMNKCLHCYKCWTHLPNDCVSQDDAGLFRAKLNEADLIVFFVPLSWASMPSDMKRAMERLMPETTPFFYFNQRAGTTAHPVHAHKKPQAFLQFLVWGFPERHHGRLLEETLREWVRHSHKKDLGALHRPGVNLILSDPRQHFVRKQIQEAMAEAAAAVYHRGEVPKKLKRIIEQDAVGADDFGFFATKYWQHRFRTDYWGGPAPAPPEPTKVRLAQAPR